MKLPTKSLVLIALAAITAVANAFEICHNVVCPPLKQINCPEDSYQQIEFPSIAQKNDEIPTNFTENEDYRLLNKRSITEVYNATEVPDAQSIASCCPFKECKCKPDFCTVPHCNSSMLEVVPIEVTAKEPGKCCTKYQCVNRSFCISSITNERYPNGTDWQEGDCVHCQCHNGESKCHMSICKPLSCTTTIRLPEKCCPVCDPKETKFCAGMEDCDKVCKHGYRPSESGCHLCKCEKSKVKSSYDMANATTLVTNSTTEQPPINCDSTNQIYIYIIIALAIFICVLTVVFSCVYSRRKTGSYSTVSTIEQHRGTNCNNNANGKSNNNNLNEFYNEKNSKAAKNVHDSNLKTSQCNCFQ